MDSPFDIAEANLAGGSAVAENPFDVAEKTLSVPQKPSPFDIAERQFPKIQRGPSPNLVSTIAGGTVGGGLHAEPFTMNDLPDAESVYEVYQDVSRPAIPLPKFTVNPGDSKLKAVGKSVANMGISLPEFVESPLGVATGGAASVIPRLVAAGFLADTTRSVSEQSKQLGSNWDSMTPGERAAAVTDLGGSTVLAAAMAHGATRMPVKDAIDIESKAGDSGDGIKQPSAPANPVNPFDQAEAALKAPVATVVDSDGIVRTPDGRINLIETANNKLRQQSKETAAVPVGEPTNAQQVGEQSPPGPPVAAAEPATVPPSNVESPAANVESKLPTIAEKAAANPTATPTMADLAAMVAEIKNANPFKPSEPKPAEPATAETSPPAEATAPASAAVSDFDRYQQLTQSLKGKSMDEAQPIMQQIEAIKNRNGGMVPEQTISQPEVEAAKNAPVAEPPAMAKASPPEQSALDATSQEAELRKWFGNSKIVDAAGNPETVFHTGSVKDNNWDIRKANDENTQAQGIYFARDRKLSEGQYEGTTEEYHLAMENPWKGDIADYYESLLPDALERFNDKNGTEFESWKSAKQELRDKFQRTVESTFGDPTTDDGNSYSRAVFNNVEGWAIDPKLKTHDLEQDGYDGQDDGWQVIAFEPKQIRLKKSFESPRSESAAPIPKLRPGEKGTGSLLQSDEPFNLAGERGTDTERIAAEKAKSEATKKLVGGKKVEVKPPMRTSPVLPSKHKPLVDEAAKDKNGNGDLVNRLYGSNGGTIEWNWSEEPHDYPFIRQADSFKKGTGKTLYLEALKHVKDEGQKGLTSTSSVKNEDGEIESGPSEEAIGVQDSLRDRGLITIEESDGVRVLTITPSGEAALKANATGKGGAARNQGKAENIGYVDESTRPTSRIADTASKPHVEQSVKAKANALADSLESLKTGITKGGQLHAFGIPALIWDKAIELAQAVIRKGGSIADAITAAIDHIKANHKGEFEEDKVHAAISQAAQKELPEGASPANKFSETVREALNLPERETPERQSSDQVIGEANHRMAKSPALAADLVDKITQNPRELKPWEQVVFLRHVVDLKKSLEQAREDVFQAKKDGNPADEEIAVLHAQELSDKVYAAVDAFERSGTPTARSLQFRNTLMKEDYSVENLEMGARAARGGERLSESELAKIKQQSDEIHATQQKLDEETKAQAERDAEDAAAHAHTEMVRQAEKEPWHAFSPEVLKQAQGIADRIKAKADKSREALRKMGYNLNSAVGAIDPTPLYHLAIIGADHAVRFSIKSAEWTNAMVAELGEGVRKHLPQIAAAAEKVLKSEGGDKIPKPRTKAGKPVDTIETLKATIKKIHEEIGEGATPKDYANLIRALAKRAVEGGMRDRNALVDSVHNVLKEKGVEITRNEVRDAISGYGDYRQLSKLEADVELRRMRAELQKVAQIEALEKGQPPLKSGMEHGKLSDDARRMVQRINQLKKELGITTGNPETQLKSALASKKTRLNNQIRDLEHEIATREKIVREHGQTPTDPETDALTTKRDALKRERDSIFKGEMSDEQRLALAERSAQRSLDEWNQKLADAQKGNFDLGETKREMPHSEKLKAVRDARDAAKAEVENLKGLAHPELAEQNALAARKASLLKSIATYQDKIARGDFTTRSKSKINPKLAALEAQKKRVFETYRAANKKATLARRPFWVKATEAVPKFIGQAVLSSPATLVKLAAASITHVALRPIDDMVGGALGRVPGLRGIAGEARTEGDTFHLMAKKGHHTASYATALAKAATQGVVDARKTLNLKATLKPIASYAKGVLTGDKAAREAAKTEFRNVPHTSDLDERFGKAGHGRDSLEFFGLLHGAEKAPLKRFVFEYNYARGVDWAERNGLDPQDPIVAMRIGLDAYKQAQRAVFLEDNRVTDAINAGLGTLARPYKAEVNGKTVEKYPALGTIGTAAIRANIPVMKVAANVMAQAFERAGGGLVMGTGRIFRHGGAEAIKRGTGSTLAERLEKGLADMPEGEADKVIGNLKRGLVGAAFMLFAFYNYNNFGGFWQKGEKRKEGELKNDEIDLGGAHVPQTLLHNPLFIAGQAAATARKVAESKLRKKDTDTQGTGAGVLAAALGIAQTTPFTREAETISQILDPHTRQGAIGRAAQMAIPQAIQAPARWMDEDSYGNTIKRNPTNIWQSLEMGIPGMRSNVPEKKK